MNAHKALEELWDSAPRTETRFDPKMVTELPFEAARFLLHVLAPGAPLASAVRLAMHGTIRLDGVWNTFEAEQVLRWDRGFIWRARARMKGLPVSGYDRLVDGEAEMRWKALGLFPVVSAAGPEIARSAAGRIHGEMLWLPGVLLGQGIGFDVRENHLAIDVDAHGEASHLMLTLDGRGAPQSFHYPRWGDPDQRGFHYESFGGVIEAERTFEGVTVPSKLRIGWYFSEEDERGAEGTRFQTEGEFFRVEVDDLVFR